MTKVVFIHGINNQSNSAETINANWEVALRTGFGAAKLKVPDQALKFQAAFYGDILNEATEDWARQSVNGALMGPKAASRDAMLEFYKELQDRAGATDEQLRALMTPDERHADDEPTEMGRNASWILLGPLVRFIDSRSSGHGQFATGFFAQQANAFLFKPLLKEEIEKVVHQQVFESVVRDEKLIVVAHSLGSVIAYSLLRKYHTLKSVLLLTVGSPLGSAVMKRSIGDPRICLKNVHSWVNVADPYDVVAIQPQLTKSTFGCAKVKNLTCKNDRKDPHGATYYLSQPQVAQAIHDAVAH